MKILLVTSAFIKSENRWVPLGLCYIASALTENGHEVKIFDRCVMAIKFGRDAINKLMVSEINEFDPDIIGFSTYTPMIYDTVEAVKIVRAVYKNTIILGGHHATALPRITLERIPEADAVIVGEGEMPFCMLADGKPKDTIPGLYWRENGIRKSNVKREKINLDDLPMPSYHLLDMDYYTEKNLATIRPYYLSVGSILTARGCNNQCTYCTESLTFSGGVRHHSLNYALENIELLIKKYKCNGITFFDNNFLADRSNAEGILKKIIQKRLNEKALFCIQARACDIDNDIAKLMKKANCVKVELGLETNNQETLDKMNKNLPVSASEKAIDICRDNGISVQANLMMGLEGETIYYPVCLINCFWNNNIF